MAANMFPSALGYVAGQWMPPAETFARSVKSWRVFHAWDNGRLALPIIDAEVSAGMRVFAAEWLRAAGDDTPLSLLTAWNRVRDWRQHLLSIEREGSVELVHAHSFATAMAGVRGVLPVVFDLHASVEECAASAAEQGANRAHAGAWLLRSFRVAEQFVLSRAAAVVVHCGAMYRAATERGAQAESLFVIPEPVEAAGDLAAGQHFYAASGALTLFAQCRTSSLETVLRGFSIFRTEMRDAVLLLHCNGGDISGEVQQGGFGESVQIIDAAQAETAHAAADLVIVPDIGSEDLAGRATPLALKAMAAGKAVLAADIIENREATADGRGCLWFESGDGEDLGRRALFLAHSADLRNALGASGRSMIAETRNPQVIASRYDEVYRRATATHSGRARPSRVGGLEFGQVCI